MQLRSLNLHGFKTFASKTILEFDGGVTAIVGPNGSGKSNLADAFRWILGEQGLRALRARRTEDVIFSGGPGRAPAGFAEAGLTLCVDSDGSSGGLTWPYPEISVVRRAYRSGENEYYLNRDRVRLKDVVDVFGQVGLGPDCFALVGQGAIDAALSLRAEDRRGLIEQAAAIGHLHARLADARARLESTQQNLARVADLLAELSPRLPALEKQARQARERESVEREFGETLLGWYGHAMAAPLNQARRAESDLALAQAEVNAHVDRQARERAEIDAARQRRVAADAERAGAVAMLERRRADHASAIRGEATARQRGVELRREREVATSAVAHWQEALADEQASLAALQRQRDELLARIGKLDATLRALEERLSGWARRRTELTRALTTARERARAATAQLNTNRSRLQVTQDRLDQLEQTRSGHVRRIAGLEDGARQSAAHVATAQAKLDQNRRELERASQERLGAAADVDRSREVATSLANQLAEFDRGLQTLRARVEALRGAEDGGVGYFPGVRAILHAANGHGPVHLDGIVGVVARLLDVSADLEVAVETALGSHSQDVVVARWTEAEAAIAHLKRTGAGRATFLPLDTLRNFNRAAPPTGPGVVGVAAALVGIDARYQKVSDFLLGQTLIVENLGVAREVLTQCAASWQIVTRDGEVTRASGTVTGGAPSASRGSLSRLREIRAGERTLASKNNERTELASQAGAATRSVATATAVLVGRDTALRAAQEAVRQVTASLAEAQRECDRATHALNLERDALRGTDNQAVTLRGNLTSLAASAQSDEAAALAATEAVATAERGLSEFEHEVTADTSTAAAERLERDQAREQLKTCLASYQRSEARARGLAERVAQHTQRESDLGVDIDQAETQRARFEREAATLAQALEAAVREAADRERIAAEARGVVERLEREAAARQEEARQAGARAQEAQRRLERARADLDNLVQQIQLELGTCDQAELANGRLRIGLPDGTERQITVEAVSGAAALRERIAALRSRLRALPANREVVAEFEEARDRCAYLERQLADLNTTATTLRGTIDETGDTMRVRFDATFVDISRSFTQRFRELFGGGSAQLILEPSAEGSGIDVVAQPPGKRSQNLATLSGGERALTAAALLFSLIEAHPPPFCLLDEVDAALDESNVSRFCATLRDLSAKTQFIVVTHNRRTMEAASTIYGLTLENRSESRVLSLRLPEGPENGRSPVGIRNAKSEPRPSPTHSSSESPML